MRIVINNKMFLKIFLALLAVVFAGTQCGRFEGESSKLSKGENMIETTNQTQNNDEQILLNVQEELRQAILNRDRAALERVLSDDFVAVGHLGNKVGKQDYVNIHLSSERDFVEWKTDDVEVRQFGGAALILGRITIRNAKSSEQNPPNRYLAAYSHRRGTWQIAAWQETPIKQENVE